MVAGSKAAGGKWMMIRSYFGRHEASRKQDIIMRSTWVCKLNKVVILKIKLNRTL